MRKAEGKIAGLEALAVAAAQQLQINAFRRQCQQAGASAA